MTESAVGEFEDLPLPTGAITQNNTSKIWLEKLEKMEKERGKSYQCPILLAHTFHMAMLDAVN